VTVTAKSWVAVRWLVLVVMAWRTWTAKVTDPGVRSRICVVTAWSACGW
jgi:hypothetical protein